MHSRWFNLAIAACWLVTMGWLIQQKVLPPLLVGNPPTLRSIVAAQESQEGPVAWSIRLNQRPLGHAVSQLVPLEGGVRELRSHVRLRRVGLDELAPEWMASFWNDPDLGLGPGSVAFGADVTSSLLVDALGQPASFQSKLVLGDSPVAGLIEESGPFVFKVFVMGVVEGKKLRLDIKVSINQGDFAYEPTVYIHPGAVLGDAFSPQSMLPGLRVGQRWTVPVYNPLVDQVAPVEVLQAHVAEEETLLWAGRSVSTLVVVLRADSGGSLSNQRLERGRMWVAAGGLVLRQEAMLGSSRIVFERLPDSALDGIDVLEGPEVFDRLTEGRRDD